MAQLPEGRRPLDDNWFITKANQLHPEPRRATMVSERYLHPLTMNDYQADTAQYAIYKWKVIYPALALNEEAGEVAGKISKLIRDQGLKFDGTEKLTDQQRADIIFELGDCLWQIAALSRDLGVSLNEVAHMNLEKLKLRAKRKTLSGSGDHR